MRNAKSGAWWEDNQQRALANNSVAYTEKPDVGTFMREWLSLYESKSGERGIFNRQAAENRHQRMVDEKTIKTLVVILVVKLFYAINNSVILLRL